MPIDYHDPADGPDAPRQSDRTPPPDGHRTVDIPPAPSDPAELDAIHRDHRARVERAYATADRDAWSRAVPGFRADWEEHEARYPDQDRPTPQTHPDGSWSSGDSHKLSPDQNAEVNWGYARVREIGERDILPGMLAVEAADPTRRLAGLDHYIKGEDRLKEKVADRVRSTPGLTPTQALEVVADAVRFTFQYGEAAYAAGVRQDTARLQDRGFIEVERRNTWSSDQYKGINGRWREPESGLVFEVQFHTQASLEAKELSHKAYERIRSAVKDPELSELKEFQRHVNSMIPIPPGVADIENYPPGDT